MYLSPTGLNWLKSPKTITDIPPNGCFDLIICCNRASTCWNIVKPTIDISSIMSNLRSFNFTPILFETSLSSLTSLCLHWLTGKLRNECKVIPSISDAALPVGAQIATRILSGLHPGSELLNLNVDWYTALIKVLLPTPAPPLIKWKNCLSSFLIKFMTFKLYFLWLVLRLLIICWYSVSGIILGTLKCSTFSVRIFSPISTKISPSLFPVS